MRIFTIGYEGATQDEVIAALRAAGVTMLADVRAVPLSRRPGFSTSIVAAGLREAGLEYVGLKALGTPGVALGWTPLLRRKVGGTARAGLDAFTRAPT